MYQKDNKNDAVLDVQSMLRILSYQGEDLYDGKPMPHVSKDGIYGTQTADAVSQFQAHRQLPVTGRVDYDTYVVLRDEVTDIQNAPVTDVFMPSEAMHRGAQGDRIILLHYMLSLFDRRHPHMYRVPKGSYFGKETECAVKVLQSCFCEEADGCMTPQLFRKVQSYLSLPM